MDLKKIILEEVVKFFTNKTIGDLCSLLSLLGFSEVGIYMKFFTPFSLTCLGVILIVSSLIWQEVRSTETIVSVAVANTIPTPLQPVLPQPTASFVENPFVIATAPVIQKKLYPYSAKEIDSLLEDLGKINKLLLKISDEGSHNDDPNKYHPAIQIPYKNIGAGLDRMFFTPFSE